MRLPVCCWSTSTSPDLSVAVTITALLLPERTEIAPYCVSTEIFALGPTVYRYSLMFPANAAADKHVTITRVRTLGWGKFRGRRTTLWRIAIKRRPCGRERRSAPSPTEYDPMRSGKEVLSVDKHPSNAAARPHPPDFDPNRPATRVCPHSRPATGFHRWPAWKERASIPRSETAGRPRSLPVRLETSRRKTSQLMLSHARSPP